MYNIVVAVQNSAKLRVLFWQASFEQQILIKKEKKKNFFFMTIILVYEKPCVKFTLEPQISDGVRLTGLKTLTNSNFKCEFGWLQLHNYLKD